MVSFSAAADWPQLGGSPARNNTPEAKNLPVQWNVGRFEPGTGRWLGASAKNIRWVAKLGSTTYGTPVVAGGKVFCATNNGAGRLKRYPATVDLGCLLCFRQSDGQFLWQLSREKLPTAKTNDFPQQGICSVPLVEGRRLWLVTNRCEVMCLDTEGFADGKNDEPNAHRDEARVLWTFDMIKELGVAPLAMSSCSVTAAGDLLLVVTSNGANEAHKQVPAPDAPSFLALDKRTGKLVWSDNSPGGNILDGQWGSPAFAVLDGVPQAIFPGGDGWLYSFLAKPSASGRPELLWKFDCNPKASLWKGAGAGDRSSLVATPVVCDGRVYVATGQDPEYGEGPGRLWCIDPGKRGDVSPELVVDRDGKPAPRHRNQALDKSSGETLRPNPNSAAVWCYAGLDANGDGTLDFNESMHRTLSMAVVKDGLAVIADIAGLVHCLDAKTGKPYWTHDLMSAVWGSPCVADGKIYIGDEDGDVVVFELSPKLKELARNAMGDAVYSTPVVADNVLYISTRSQLIAVGGGK